MLNYKRKGFFTLALQLLNMKKTLLSLAILWAAYSNAQDLRYYNKVFTDVKKDSNIVYGNNYGYDLLAGELGLTSKDLDLDIYQPAGDTLKNRPLIIWAHGGSFLGGSKEDADIVYFCNEFSQRGFVNASITYRYGYEQPIDSVNAVRTVYRALQDGRAAVRYLRSKADSLGIDPSRIYFGGTSAGAFIALNITYLNLPSEVPAYLDTNERLSVNTIRGFGLDGIEGLTNDIQESSEIQGIINFCGATKVTSWMDDDYSSSVPVISMHGTRDGTVPFGTRVINLNDLTPIPEQPAIPIIGVQGSYDIDRHADKQGYTSKFYTWYGADHVPYINFHSDSISALYMDTLMSFTVKHVYEDFLGLGTVDGLAENDPPCDFNNGDTLPCVTSVYNGELEQQEVSIYPNPGSDFLNIELNNSHQVKVMNQIGKIMFESSLSKGKSRIDTKNWSRGVYFIQSGTTTTKWIKN